MNEAAPRITADKPCLPPYSPEQQRDLLTDVLKAVSRSFYLTLRALPGKIRSPIGTAYLLARAADTIADTKVVPRDRRLAMLLQLRRQLETGIVPAEIADIQRALTPHQSLPAERVLLEKLQLCFAMYGEFDAPDRQRIADVVITLTRGMEFDLTRFPGESADQLAALDTPEELDRYTYLVAGCVGPFWTRMCAAHLKELDGWKDGSMEETSIRFGKGLQLCNVLRDIPKDLQIGRCYLPAQELAGAGLKPADLLEPGNAAKLRPLYERYIDRALSQLDAAWRYTLAVPATLPRLRLACAWPILIGLKTLAKLRGNVDILQPDRRIKISRAGVYGLMARTFFIKKSDAKMNRYYERLVQEASNS